MKTRYIWEASGTNESERKRQLAARAEVPYAEGEEG